MRWWRRLLRRVRLYSGGALLSQCEEDLLRRSSFVEWVIR